MDHALDQRILLRSELEQRQQSGYDIGLALEKLEFAGGLDTAPDDVVEAAHDALEKSTRSPEWPSDEPDTLDEIRQASEWPESSTDHPLNSDYRAAVLRAWGGRVVGNMLGKPVEGWSRSAVHAALTANDAWPLADYFPPRSEESVGLDNYVDCWTETTRGNIAGSARDDDVDYTILNLHVLEQYGDEFDTDDIAKTWLELLPYLQTFTAERVAIRNLLRGAPAQAAALHRNPYREFIGAAIRADIFGVVNPGDPAKAAEMAYRDARLSHRANGIYSEMWCAALISSAFTTNSAEVALTRSLTVVPSNSRLHRAVIDVIEYWQGGLTWEATLDQIDKTWHGVNLAHALNNAAILAAGVLYGNGDFDSTITLTVSGGLDTDSNGATAGSVAGILSGNIPTRWLAPLEDTVRSAVFGYDRISLTSLANRTVSVATHLRESSDQALPSLTSPPPSEAQ